ncbi:MAG: peptidase M14 [Bdellovibrionales bacterium]|nr:peptidase M14 [Bdellovibrionales bacterium]
MRIFFFLTTFLITSPVFANAKALKTLGEISNWKQTGRYLEVERLCKTFARRYPEQVDCISFGTTPEGRTMRALVVADSKRGLSAFWAKRKQRPVIYFQGGIHAGEIDGKDAGFWLLRQILEKEAPPKLLKAIKNVTLVFVPVFNVDGHERFGKNNRPNQVGPEEMGWRTTAQNYNLNRDYLKADSIEMQQLLKLLQRWDPIVGLDLHVTDGAQFQHDVSLIMEPLFHGVKELRELTKGIHENLLESLKVQGHLPVGFYPSFITNDDPSSGFSLSVAPPRYSQGYLSLKNRIGILVETHSWKNYATRVQATRNVLENIIILAGENGKQWKRVIAAVDAKATNQIGESVGLTFENTERKKEIEFLGYRYKKENSAVSGGIKTGYFPSEPEIWKIPLYDEVVPKIEAEIPEGYWVPKAFSSVVLAKLDVHGISYRVITDGFGEKEVGVFRADTFSFANRSFEGHQGLTITGDWKKEKRVLSEGDVFITCRQPKSLLVVHLFEPKAPDSLLAWGFFNTRFEPKEYMENYVAEVLGEEMLLKPEIQKVFEEKLGDPEFRNSDEKRLEFFHRLHSSWDENLGLYPVYRATEALK